MCDENSLVFSGNCISLSDCITKKGYNNSGICDICPNTKSHTYLNTCKTKAHCGSCLPCPINNGFYIDYSGNCKPCDPSCKSCSGPYNTDCKSCAYPG